MPMTTYELPDTLAPSQPSNQPIFAAPSHQYAAYPQNNGLPAGALLDTYGLSRTNRPSSNYGPQYYGGVSDIYGITPTDDLDFSYDTTYTNAYNDMDMDFSTPLEAYATQGTSTDFVNPSAVEVPKAPEQPPQPQQPRRAYPGMHQEQAARAQAEAQRQKQKALAEKQQNAAASSSRAGRASADPIVEDRISRLLNEMRHNSVSSHEDDAASPDQGSSGRARTKKEEEEMDEDERLLASEEGKKLSSKERRQLRNKVSARAFRSRRKGSHPQSCRIFECANEDAEYIGQLEGETAARISEADELRVKNQALVKENKDLRALTEMLLKSPAFNDFVQDIGGSVNSVASSASRKSPVKTEAEESAVPKDVNPNQAEQQQNTPYIGMTMIPEHSMDLNSLAINANAWAGNADLGLYDAQVFAVTSVPEGPAIDEFQFANLSGKSSDFTGLSTNSLDKKAETPSIEPMPVAEPAEPAAEAIVPSEDDDDFDASDPAFILYTDSPTTPSASAQTQAPLFGPIQPEKAFGRVELILEDEETNEIEVSLAALLTFERMCSNLEDLSNSIAARTPFE